MRFDFFFGKWTVHGLVGCCWGMLYTVEKGGFSHPTMMQKKVDLMIERWDLTIQRKQYI